MARKGKEIDLGGVRIQVDPLVLLQRIFLRQKLLLVLVALLGGIATVVIYLKTPKLYMSRSNILIRYENFDAEYLQKLLNVAVGYLGADVEMMLIINELDLYAQTRAALPYELALRSIRRELTIRNQPRNIEVAFFSKDPVQAQRVVAFTTERLLGKMAELNEAPFTRNIEALEQTMSEIEPKKRAADAKLFEFRAKHPEIASRVSDFLPGGSPLDAINAEIGTAERELIAARRGDPSPDPLAAVKNTPAMAKLKELEAELLKLRARYTDSHPEVARALAAVEAQRARVRAEIDPNPRTGNPEEAKRARIARAEARLKELLARKVDKEKELLNSPKLQGKWGELSSVVANIESDLRQARNKLGDERRERLLAANRFQENFQLVDAARVPELPSHPDRKTFMLTGMGVTAVVGLLLAALREALRQTFADATEFEEQTALQVFAVLPNIQKKEA